MHITAEQVRAFHRRGYCVVPDFFSARETAALQAEVERFKREGLVRNVATEGDGRTHSTTRANLQLIPLADKSDLLRALPFEPRVLEAVGRLIGEPLLLHLDQMFLKPARCGMGTDWHQDNAYFKIRDPMKGTAMWVAVHEATVVNGTLHVIPGSQREEYEHDRDPNSDHHLHCRPPAGRAVPVELPAGGAAFFCYGTAHCTGANTSGRERAGLAFHFLHAGYARADERRRRVHLTGPEATGGKEEYGLEVAGTWARHVERILSPCRNGFGEGRE